MNELEACPPKNFSSAFTIDPGICHYDVLERDDLLAALAYAARVSDAKRVALAE